MSAVVKQGATSPYVDIACNNGDVNATTYNFYRATVTGSSCPKGTVYALLNASPMASCTYEDTTVVSGTTDCYVATELSSVVNSECAKPPCESPYSDPAVAVINSPSTPNPPTALTVGTIVNGQVPLSWIAPAPQTGVTVNGFTVWRGTKPVLPHPTKIATITSTSYTDNGCARTCYYEVKATDTVSGNSVVTAPSNIVEAKVK